MKNFVASHAAFLSVIVVTTMGINGVFVDKGNAWSHWSWILQIALILVYLAIEFLRYKKETLSVEERFKEYLLDFESWEETEENHWHYKPEPNFIVEPTSEDYWEVEGAENWVRAATNPRAFVRPMQIRYDQTIIRKIVCIYYDEMRYFIPVPKVTGISGAERRWFYSLCADEYDFYLAPLLTKRSKEEILKTGQFGSRGGRVPVAIFKSKQEQSQFEVFLTQRPIEDDELVNFPSRDNDPYINETDKEIISYSNAVLERLAEYRGLVA